MLGPYFGKTVHKEATDETHEWLWEVRSYNAQDHSTIQLTTPTHSLCIYVAKVMHVHIPL
jgi:pentose-5-phosphate-3-epimerase